MNHPAQESGMIASSLAVTLYGNMRQADQRLAPLGIREYLQCSDGFICLFFRTLACPFQ